MVIGIMIIILLLIEYSRTSIVSDCLEGVTIISHNRRVR